MNKSDIKLILWILVISVILILSITLLQKNDNKVANVYYENDLVLSIELDKNIKKLYTVKGYNGDIIIEVNNDKIRVKEETSPLNLCSKMGWIKDSHEVIICLPNKVVIEIKSKSVVDTTIK